MGTLTREIYDSLLAFREARRLSQVQAAALVGISQAQWSRLESGLSGARPRIARHISKITGVPLETLLNFGEVTNDVK